MSRLLAGLTFCAVAILASFPTVLSADELNKKTVVTFNQPVEIPGGKVLPAGTYVFKLLDSASSRHIVQIFDKDEKQFYATLLAIPDYRQEPPDKPIISFEERASGSPEALKAWFYPGDNFGQQFVYPQAHAKQIAKRTGQPVLAMDDQMGQNITTPVSSVNEPAVRQMQKAKVTAVSPSGQPVDMETVVSTKPKK